MADWLGSIAGGLLEGAFGLAGGAMNSQAIKEANRNSLAYSDYFNKNKIQMAVADAKKAGISPYAALGSATGAMSPTFTANTAQGDALGKVGSALQNALVNATFQEIDDNSKMKELDIQMKELEIAEKKAQIAKMNNQDYPSFTNLYKAMNGDVLVTLDSNLMEYASENSFKDLAMNKRILGELALHSHDLNNKEILKGSDFRYVPASIDEIALNGGLPYVKRVLRDDWVQWQKKREEEARREAEFERARKARYKRYGDPSKNTSVLRGSRQPTYFNFTYTGK